MKYKKFISKHGILFFITGLSGAGKTSIAKRLKPFIQKNYGITIIISSEKIRKIFGMKGFSQKEREYVGLRNIKLLKYIINQKINVIYDAIALRKLLRKKKRESFKNYIEIYIKTSIKKTFNYNKKTKIYKKIKKNIVGLDIKAEYPSTPDILIKNDFDRSLENICLQLKSKIKNKIIL